MRYIPIDRVCDAFELFWCGSSIREVAYWCGISKTTSGRYRRIFAYLVNTLDFDEQWLCGCGSSAGHNGWCDWRYKRSKKRQAYQAKRLGRSFVGWEGHDIEPPIELVTMGEWQALVNKLARDPEKKIQRIWKSGQAFYKALKNWEETYETKLPPHDVLKGETPAGSFQYPLFKRPPYWRRKYRRRRKQHRKGIMDRISQASLK